MPTINESSKFRIYFVILLVVFQLVVVFYGIRFPVWGDEGHFVDTVKDFGKEFSLKTLTTYNEMSTPLPFILYSFWGRLFNFELITLRLFSLLIAVVTYFLAYKLFLSALNDKYKSLLLTALLVVNPYMIGFSVFVFTDMLAILFLILSCLAYLKRNTFLLAVALACAVLCRQYLVFLTVAVGVYYFLRYLKERDNVSLKMLLGIALSSLPMVALLLLWKGASPDNVWRRVYQHDVLSFHPDSLVLYIAQCFIYLFPVVIIYWKTFYTNSKIRTFSIITSFSYWIFPVKASYYSSELHQVPTVGFFHKFIRATVGNGLEQAVFYLCFLFALPIILTILIDSYTKLTTQKYNFLFLLEITLFAFLLIMPFSYLSWEKYFMPILPILVMLIILLRTTPSPTGTI